MSDIFKDWSFGGQLRDKRIKEGYTLREYAKLIGSDPGNLSKLERSELDPPTSRENFEAVVKPLDLEFSEAAFMMSACFNFHLAKLRARFE